MLSYAIFIFAVGGVYALLSLSLNLVWGGVGMVNLGLAGFFAVGAYASAMATKFGGVPVPLGLLLALAAGAIVGLVVTFSTLRLRDDYLAIVTLGFAEVVRLVASNEIWLTNGTDGIPGIPRPFPSPSPVVYNSYYLIFVTVIVIAVFLMLRRLDRSPYGRALRAIREDQTVAAVAGKPVTRFKAEAFAIAAAIAALAGALYGHLTFFVAPDLFQPLITIYIFLAVTVGGTGRPAGAVCGAYALIVFLEATRFFAEWIPGISPLQAAAAREAAVGLALILLLRFRPNGLLPELRSTAPRF
ncbi:MAG: branched-chain amino acid ABC transporter permease [Alphaproteobacteria bacterium]|nr:branched-chain amino acid ABC transporter permease [Alphaproteobacteria bacterium]